MAEASVISMLGLEKMTYPPAMKWAHLGVTIRAGVADRTASEEALADEGAAAIKRVIATLFLSAPRRYYSRGCSIQLRSDNILYTTVQPLHTYGAGSRLEHILPPTEFVSRARSPGSIVGASLEEFAPLSQKQNDRTPSQHAYPLMEDTERR